MEVQAELLRTCSLCCESASIDLDRKMVPLKLLSKLTLIFTDHTDNVYKKQDDRDRKKMLVKRNE